MLEPGPRLSRLDAPATLHDMSPFHSRRTLCRALLICPLAMGLWQGSQGLWIHAKAWLAQILLERAW